MIKVAQVIVLLLIASEVYTQIRIPSEPQKEQYGLLTKDSLLFRQQATRKIDFRMEVGTSIALIDGNTFSATYLSPYLFIPVSDRFSLEFGTRISKGNSMVSFNPYIGETVIPFGQNLMQSSIYTRGRYKISNSLSVYGTGYYEKTIFLLPSKENINNRLDTRAVSLGMEYKLGKASRIIFEMQMRNSSIPTLIQHNSHTFSQSMFPTRQ